jgi:hypothetical protein
VVERAADPLHCPGIVGLDWQLGGFAADATGASSAAMGGPSQVGQLVQAMASFGAGSGAADSLNPVALGTDTSQHVFDGAAARITATRRLNPYQARRSQEAAPCQSIPSRP